MYSSFLGSNLLSSSGKLATETALSAPVIALYFSAHWCSPCRAFTPLLSKYYKEWNKTQKEIEIIFISSDKDESSFSEYFKEMPWLALPFEERKIKDQLSKKYEVPGIPTLVVVSKNGEGLNLQADEDVKGDEAIVLAKFKALYK